MKYKYNKGSAHASLQLMIIEWLREHAPEDAAIFELLRTKDGGRLTIDRVAMRMASAAIEVGEIASEAA